MISARAKNLFIVPPKATVTGDVGIVIVTIQMLFATSPDARSAI
jgi:hypothetical protein